jgi:hypothetical protein
MLEHDPRQRLTAQEVLSHDWVRTPHAAASAMPLPDVARESLRGFQAMRLMQRGAAALIRSFNMMDCDGYTSDASTAPSPTVVRRFTSNRDKRGGGGGGGSGSGMSVLSLRRLFDLCDSDGNGIISRSELSAAFRRFGAFLSDDEVDELFSTTAAKAAKQGLSSSSSQAQQGESGGEVGISFEDFCVAFHDYGDGSSAAGGGGSSTDRRRKTQGQEEDEASLSDNDIAALFSLLVSQSVSTLTPRSVSQSVSQSVIIQSTNQSIN